MLIPLIFSARFGTLTGFPNLDLWSAVDSESSDEMTSMKEVTETLVSLIMSSANLKTNQNYKFLLTTERLYPHGFLLMVFDMSLNKGRS